MSAPPNINPTSGDDDDDDDDEPAINFEAPAGGKKKKKKKKKTKPAKRKQEITGGGGGEEKKNEEGEGDDDDDDDDEVKVDFTLCDPIESDFHALKHFLDHLLDTHNVEPEKEEKEEGEGGKEDKEEKKEEKKEKKKKIKGTVVNLSELADIIAGQVSVGSMIKTEGGDDPLGFITLLPYQYFKERECMKQIRQALLGKAPQEERHKLASLFDDTKNTLGLLIQDRMINLPLELTPPLHQAIVADLSWAETNEEDQSLRSALKSIANILIVCRCWHSPLGKQRTEQTIATHTKQKGGKRQKQVAASESLFFRFEEQSYADASHLRFSYQATLPETHSEMDTLPQSRVVCVLERSKFVQMAESLAL